MPGEDQMPFFLPMEDGSYQYLATVEPDGEAYSLMRIYLINALTGERQVYRFDKPGRPRNLGSGTDVSHVFVRFFAVVSGVFCLKKCCVFFELLLCVLGSFCS